MSYEEMICKHMASDLQGKDWHKLSEREQHYANLLEAAGYLKPSVVAGFLGPAA